MTQENGIPKPRDKYILDKEKNIIPADLMEWATFFETNDRIVKQEEIDGKFISTVFLGLNHDFSGRGKPLIFETMIFKDGKEVYLNRYSTWKEAEEGHAEAVEWVKNGAKDDE